MPGVGCVCYAGESPTLAQCQCCRVRVTAQKSHSRMVDREDISQKEEWAAVSSCDLQPAGLKQPYLLAWPRKLLPGKITLMCPGWMLELHGAIPIWGPVNLGHRVMLAKMKTRGKGGLETRPVWEASLGLT